jgi:hypothetical protein
MADRLAQMFKLMQQPKYTNPLAKAVAQGLHASPGGPPKIKPPRPSVPHPPLGVPTPPPLPKGFVPKPPRPNVPHPHLPVPKAPTLPDPQQQSQHLAVSRLEREITHAALELDRLHQSNLEAIGTPRLSDGLAAFEMQVRLASQKMREYDEKLKYLA